MTYPPQTTGLGVAARVVVNQTIVQLANIGDTFQLVPSVVDAAGNAVASSGTFNFCRFAPGVIGLDIDGLITAIAPGTTEITVSYTDVRGRLDTAVRVSVAPCK